MKIRTSSSALVLGAAGAVLVAVIVAVLVIMSGNGSSRPGITAGTPTASSTDGAYDPNKPLMQGSFIADDSQAACDWGITLSKDVTGAGNIGNGANDGAFDINSRTCNGRPELHANLSRMALVSGTPTEEQCAQAVAEQGKGMIAYADIPIGYGVCVARSAGSYVSYLQPVRSGSWPSGAVTWKFTVWSATAAQ